MFDTDKPKKPVNNTANKEEKMLDDVELLLVNVKKVGIEFTSGVIHGMRIFRDVLQGRNVNFAFDGGPGNGSINRLFNDSDDTLRGLKVGGRVNVILRSNLQKNNLLQNRHIRPPQTNGQRKAVQ